MKTTVRLLLIAALAVSVAACCSCRKGRKNAKPLTGTTWSLVEWQGRPFQAKDNYRLVFGTEEGRFGGRGDCNSIMGNYSVTDKGGMKIESVASNAGLLSRSGAGRPIYQRTGPYRLVPYRRRSADADARRRTADGHAGPAVRRIALRSATGNDRAGTGKDSGFFVSGPLRSAMSRGR